MSEIYPALPEDTGLAEEYFDTLRRAQYLEPEKALLHAILKDAIDAYLKCSSARDRAGKERFAEAERWIMDTSDTWIFSFQNVCELLGLDPGYIRRGLRELKEKPLEKRKRRRKWAEGPGQ
ncbi:MAG TPA: hypothetical protein VNN77_13645 [candidate division Zixibacteria bacterium]|nr:hypothetical protein [candidate division Zixibacteria bacterium]